MANQKQPPPHWWNEAKTYLAACDTTLASFIEVYSREYLWSRGDLFYTLVRAVTGQQISIAAADAIWARLEAVGPIAPSVMLAHSTEALRATGLSYRKIEYLYGIAEAMPALRQHDWAAMDDAQVVKTLCKVRGIGPWTAEMALIFHHLRPDILPLGDIGLIRAVEKHYAEGAHLTKAAVAEIAEAWRPYRTAATWYLWRSLDPVPVEY